ncbi:putative disease resistance protein [Vitis vinifera]|uniref:Putative disease resistance protein n=1 Tax=Vitis vinifera TaxID=29760 RepID=A0A438HU43_VITVI|nr:putative disease resistance protein [Vitis vinifera]
MADFDVVIWVVVSKPSNVEKIQKVLWNKLQIPRDGWEFRSSKEEKAVEILRVLKTKKFVLLLDDIWERLDPLEMGVPRPDARNKSKIVFTTRSQDVCHQMKAHKSIEVACLSSEAAWTLFQKELKEAQEIPKLKEAEKMSLCDKKSRSSLKHCNYAVNILSGVETMLEELESLNGLSEIRISISNALSFNKLKSSHKLLRCIGDVLLFFLVSGIRVRARLCLLALLVRVSDMFCHGGMSADSQSIDIHGAQTAGKVVPVQCGGSEAASTLLLDQCHVIWECFWVSRLQQVAYVSSTYKCFITRSYVEMGWIVVIVMVVNGDFLIIIVIERWKYRQSSEDSKCIRELPIELKNLKNLASLFLDEIYALEIIPSGVILSLTSLKLFSMWNDFGKSNSLRGHEETLLEELGGLEQHQSIQLERLDISRCDELKEVKINVEREGWQGVVLNDVPRPIFTVAGGQYFHILHRAFIGYCPKILD